MSNESTDDPNQHQPEKWSDKAALLGLMGEKWDDFQERHNWTFWEWPQRQAAEAAIASVMDPDNVSKREDALIKIAELRATERTLKACAELCGRRT